MPILNAILRHIFRIPSPTPSETLILERLNTMSEAQSQLAAALEAKTDQIVKAIQEVTEATAALQEQIEGLDTISPELQAAFDRLAGTVQQLDDLNPDEPEPEPEPEPTPA